MDSLKYNNILNTSHSIVVTKNHVTTLFVNIVYRITCFYFKNENIEFNGIGIKSLAYVWRMFIIMINFIKCKI